MFHIFTCGTSRATDYADLTFRNGTNGIMRKLEFFTSKWILIEKQSRKTSFLKGKPIYSFSMVPSKWCGIVLQYWLNIRPLACILVRALGQNDLLERYQRFCFIKASEKVVRKQITKVLEEYIGPGATFQRLRHAAEGLYRHRIAPKEYAVQQEYDYDPMFGHSSQTGRSYSVLELMGSGHSTEGTDITSIERVLNKWIEYLKLRNPEEILNSEARENDDEARENGHNNDQQPYSDISDSELNEDVFQSEDANYDEASVVSDVEEPFVSEMTEEDNVMPLQEVNVNEESDIADTNSALIAEEFRMADSGTGLSCKRKLYNIFIRFNHGRYSNS
jgi:hypothetical protein